MFGFAANKCDAIRHMRAVTKSHFSKMIWKALCLADMRVSTLVGLTTAAGNNVSHWRVKHNFHWEIERSRIVCA